MKTQQNQPDMLKQMAESMNLSVPEFEEMMREEHGLAPPDEPDEDEDYFSPPERRMSINAMSPDAAKIDADACRKCLLDSALSRYEAEDIANHIAQCVSTYGDIEERVEELKLPESNKTKAQSNASRLEHNALIQVQQDKAMTTHQADSLNSVASTLGLMNKGKFAGQNIDLIALKEGIERQMDELVASGTAREKRIAQFVILAQGAAEKLMIEATQAPTAEATAMVMEKATKIMGTATKMLKELDEMVSPKLGRLVEHAPDKQLPTKMITGKK